MTPLPATTPLRRRRAAAVSVLAIAVRSGTLAVLVVIAGIGGFDRVLGHADVAWVPLLVGASLATYPLYAVAYRVVARCAGRGALSLGLATRIVVAGFGPVAVAGGFGVDRDVFSAMDDDEAGRVSVSALGMMEWAVLAPIVWVASLVVVAESRPIGASITWPWLAGVPAAVAAGAVLTGAGRLERLIGRRRWQGRRIRRSVAAVGIVRTMVAKPIAHRGAWVGLATYWLADIACFLAAIRVAGLGLGAAGAVLAYGSGYVGSRRSLPLGGAGLAEAFLTYGLHELGQPLASAVVAVMFYRSVSFVLVVIPALVAYRTLGARLPVRDVEGPAVVTEA